MRTILCTVLVLAASAARAENPEATKAAEAVARKDWGDALKAADAGLKAPGNDRDTLAQLYLLKGIAQVMTRKENPGKVSFQAALWIKPDLELPGKADAKVMKTWRAARDWTRAAPGLEFREEPAATDDKGRVMQIAAQLKTDPLKLGKKVRFHLNADKKGWGEVEEPIQSSYAATGTDAAGVEWWAELLGDKGAVLGTLGSQGKPILEGTAKEEKKVAKKDPPPKPEPTPAVAAAEKPKDGASAEPRKSWPEDAPTQASTRPREETPGVSAAPSGGGLSGMRVGGIVLLAGGVAAGVVGVIAGASSAGTRGQLAGLQEDANGRVVGMTQRQAADLEAGANTAATLANVMYVTAGVLGATGILLIAVGGSSSSGGKSEPEFSLAPAGPGVVLSGTLP